MMQPCSENIHFLIIILMTVFAPFFIHLVLVRIFGLFKKPFLRQKGIVVSCTVGYLVTAALFILFVKVRGSENSLSFFYSGFYLFFIYTVFAYVYFHVFNLSETARRIKMLAECKKSNGITKEQLSAKYRCEDMVSNRLKRLSALGIVKIFDNRYILGNKTLLYAARLLFAFEKIIFLDRT